MPFKIIDKKTEKKTDLSPIGKNLSIASISHQFFRKLSYLGVQIVENHVDDRGSFSCLGFDIIQGISTNKEISFFKKSIMDEQSHS